MSDSMPWPIVQVVVLDDVAVALIRPVAPGPADGDGRVVEVVDVVVGDDVAAGLADPHADGRRKHQADVVDVVVAHDVLPVALGVVGALDGFADPDAPAARVRDFVAGDTVLLRPAPEPDGVAADLAEHATLDGALFGAHRLERGLRGHHRRLRVGVAPRPHAPIGVREMDAAKDHAAHQFALLRAAFQAHQPRQRRRDDFLLRQVLSGHRPVADHAGLAVQVPLARRVQRVGRVLDVVARVGFAVRTCAGRRPAWRCAPPDPPRQSACGGRPRPAARPPRRPCRPTRA